MYLTVTSVFGDVLPPGHELQTPGYILNIPVPRVRIWRLHLKLTVPPVRLNVYLAVTAFTADSSSREQHTTGRDLQIPVSYCRTAICDCDKKSHLQQGRLEPWRLLEVLQQSPRGGNEDVHPHHRRLLLAELLLAPRDQPRRQLVVLAEDTQHLEDLEGQLSRRGDDECCQAVSSSAASRRGAIDNRRQNAGTRNSLGQRAVGGNSQ